MTPDTTFKEFVEERNLKFSLLDFDSPEYMDLVEAFNERKLRLEAEEDARQYAKERARLMLDRQPPAEGLPGRRAQRPKSGVRFAGPRP